jgi:hypothetical protein
MPTLWRHLNPESRSLHKVEMTIRNSWFDKLTTNEQSRTKRPEASVGSLTSKMNLFTYNQKPVISTLQRHLDLEERSLLKVGMALSSRQ